MREFDLPKLATEGVTNFDTSAQVTYTEGETPEEELKRLRRENSQLKQEREVLKRSVAFFVRDRS